MKKLSILLLALFYIGIANVSAQTDATAETVTTTEEVAEVKKCAKTGKICDNTCKNKKNGTCCKGKKAKKGSFNFNSSNNYTGKSSCSKSAKKACCKKKKAKKCGEGCTKPCCTKSEDTGAPVEEDSSEK